MSRRPSGKKLFTVGLVSDTHCNEREDFSASPYPANAEANPRARWIFAQLNKACPALVIHLGDMINPVPELPSYEVAAIQFKKIANCLTAPLYMVPGNHDVGDKPVSWMPAGVVCDDFIRLYECHFGQQYYSFEQNGILFIVLNASLFNSGLGKEIQQCKWLKQTLADNQGKRSFVFSHYPLYVSSPDEPNSYDNIDEPGRGWLIDAIKEYRPEALFAGHVHNFWYDVVGDTETYVMPSTSFVRHDYSEMNRIEAGDQYGRNDVDKLGYVLLDIYEKGHVANYVRSYGHRKEATHLRISESASVAEWPATRMHTKVSTINNLGVDMRHSWAEEFDIAPSGAVDEFGRKRARNDYPVMALWEMGLRRMRIPMQDLVDPRTRRRMKLMYSIGHLFNIYCFNMPTEREAALLAKYSSMVDRLEIVISWDTAGQQLVKIAKIRWMLDIPIVISRVNRKDSSVSAKEGRYNHLVSHGFTLPEGDGVAAKLFDVGFPAPSIMFTIPRNKCPVEAIRWANNFEKSNDIRPCLYIKSTSASPAETFVDDFANAIRILHTSMASVAYPNVDVILDTFVDADRGYFVRTGLVDRRYNLRLAGRSVAAMASLVNGQNWRIETNEQFSSKMLNRYVLANEQGESIALVDADNKGMRKLSLVYRQPSGSSKTIPLLSPNTPLP